VVLPTIVSFKANPTSVITGEVSTLTAVFANGTGTITSNDGKPVINLGTAGTTAQTFTPSVSPTKTTSYTLNVKDTNGNSAQPPSTLQVTFNNPGEISFEVLTTEVAEADVEIFLNVVRTSGDGTVTVDYLTNGNGTASSGLDYLEILPTTITFNPGDTKKLIPIPIVIKNDTIPKEFPSEFFTVSLVNPKGGASLAPNKSLHTITIIDNDILSLNFSAKQLNLTWDPYPNATLYKLFENKNGAGFIEIGQFTGTVHSISYSSLFKNAWIDASYMVSACIVTCVNSNEVSTLNQELNAIGYFQASNLGNTNFGRSVAISSDGNTMAVGALLDNTGALPNEKGSGAAYVFIKNSTTGLWTEQALLQASNAGAGYFFGTQVALSSDGNTLAVGAPRENRPIGGVSQLELGAVYVFKRNGSVWKEVAYLKASNPTARDAFGFSVALNDAGNILAVGSIREDGSFDGAGSGPQDDTQASVNSGAVYVFIINSLGIWEQQSYVKANNATGNFGTSVSLNSTGSILAVGADYEGSGSGAAYIFIPSSGKWFQKARLTANNLGATDRFGKAVSISGDGATLAVGAYLEGSDTTGVNSTPNNNILNAGAVYIFTLPDFFNWKQTAYIKPGNTSEFDWFGTSVALSYDGKTLAVGHIKEDSSSVGLNSTPDEVTRDAGAVYIYSRAATTWTIQSYIKPKVSSSLGQFGGSVALTPDGKTLVVGSDIADEVHLY